MLLKISDVGVKLADGNTPVPLRLTIWLTVIVPAPSDRVKVADLPNKALGVKVTSIEQVLVPPVNDVGSSTLPVQLLALIAKSAAFVPEIAALLKVSEPRPVLVTVTVLVALVVPTCILPNARGLGNALPEGGTPMPDRATVWVTESFGLSELSVRVNVAASLPIEFGVKVT